MGCDIHLYVEKKNIETGKWVNADEWNVSNYDDEYCYVTNPIYDGRNYELFAILADVRNRMNIIPICQRRGMPYDASKEVISENEHWRGDAHSHSWLTLKELMEYDWTQVAAMHGVVDGLEFKRWNKYGRKEGRAPKSYCQGAYGANIKNISEERMVELTEDKNTNEDYLRACYCYIEWKEPYYRLCSMFLGESIPRMWRLGTPENVRIVFWFDN